MFLLCLLYFFGAGYRIFVGPKAKLEVNVRVSNLLKDRCLFAIALAVKA